MRRFLIFCLVAVSASCLSMAAANGATSAAEFWKWFEENEADFPSTADFDAAYGYEVSGLLDSVKPGLVYEISNPVDGQKEFIISADGISELIPDVKKLVQAAPDLKHWKFIAFRPRVESYENLALTFSGYAIDPKQLWCYSQVKDGYFDLVIFHPEYSNANKDAMIHGTLILLDMALGEYDVMTGIRYIDNEQLPVDRKLKGLYPFTELRQVFDAWKARRTLQ